MGSRLRENPEHLIDCFLEIAAPQGNDSGPWVLQKFPEAFADKEILKSVPQFCYPCEIQSTVVQVFSFVLTGADSKWTFGYCRHTPKAPTALCLLSSLPWHETFYELLNRIAEITHRKEASDLIHFLEAIYAVEVPEPGSILTLNYDDETAVVQCSDHTKLPSIPENRNLSEYFNAVDAQNMMILFASILNERRILITSSKLSRLSACIQAANSLIYPMHWQHIFIPILPIHLLDYLSAPMPFLIGAPKPVLEKAYKLDLSEVVVLYADQNKIETPFDDLQALPPEILSSLKRHLKNSTAMLGDRVARSFLHALVQLIGGYRDALNFEPGQKITFNRDAFIQTRTPSMQPFLQRMLHLQIFQQFIEERLEMLNAGQGFSDEFETEMNRYEEKKSTKLRNQYKEWTSNMRKEGGAFLKSVKNKVKDKSKRAYKEVRSKIQEMQQKEPGMMQADSSSLKPPRHPRSAPSSPTPLRTRPTTYHGLKDKRGSISGSSSGSSNSSIGKSKIPMTVMLSRSADEDTTAMAKHYQVLEIAETVDEAGSSSGAGTGEESHSGSSSPGMTLRRINMDLMGDLQDIIFRRCSIGESASSSSNSVANDRPPDPSVPQQSEIQSATQEELLLIQLDTSETDNEVEQFDPLLAKPGAEMQTGRDTTVPAVELFQNHQISASRQPQSNCIPVPVNSVLNHQHSTYVRTISPPFSTFHPAGLQSRHTMNPGLLTRPGLLPYNNNNVSRPTIVVEQVTSQPAPTFTVNPNNGASQFCQTNPFLVISRSQSPSGMVGPMVQGDAACFTQFPPPLQPSVSASNASLGKQSEHPLAGELNPFSQSVSWENRAPVSSTKQQWETFN